MSNFFRLFAAQFLSVLTGNFEKKKNSTKNRYTGPVILVIFLLAYASYFEYLYISQFVPYSGGNNDILITIVVLASSMLTLLSAIGTSKALIFTSFDYDMLTSMPIKGSTIVASKLFTLYVFELIYSSVFVLPCGIIFGIVVHPPVYFYFAFYLLSLFVPLIPLVIGSLIGALVSYASAHFKYSKIIGTLFYFALFAGWMYFVMKLTSNTNNYGAASSVLSAFEPLKKVYPPSELFTKAALHGDYLSAVIFVAVSLFSFAVVCFVFGLGYKKIHAVFAARFTGEKYKMAGGGDSPMRACVKKEFARFFSSSMVIMNSLAGVVMMIVLSVLIAVKSKDAMELLTVNGVSALGGVLDATLPFFFAMFASMSCTTNSSISLEGRNIYMLKSFPLSPKTIFRAKLAVHIIIIFPCVAVCAAIISAFAEIAPFTKLMMLLLPLSYAYFTGVFGLWLNAKNHKFEWTNEVEVVKQSFPVFVTAIGGLVICFIPMFASAFLFSVGAGAVIFPSAMCILLLIISLVIRSSLMRNAEKLYSAM